MQIKQTHPTRQHAAEILSNISWKSFQRLGEQITSRELHTGLVLWVLFTLFLALVQFSTPDLPDNDGYYHIKLAYLMRTEGLKPEFTWLPLSILNEREYYDHHFLFHVALTPFTFGDLRTGAKWSAVFFASLAFLSAWVLLKNQRIAYSPVWAFGLAAMSEAFIYRMSITRAQSLSLLVLLIGLDWLLRRKYKHLIVLGFVYVWLYNAFPLLGVLAGVVFAVTWLYERKPDFKLLESVGLGLALGLLINPYFPHNIVFAIQHIMPKLTATTAVSVGNEWYPYNTAQLLENSPYALIAFLSGGLALGLSGKKMDARTATSFLIAGLFGLMLFQSRRFIEYFAPFALIFAAFAWTPVLTNLAATLRGKLQKWLPPATLILVMLPGAWITLQGAKDSIQNSKPYETYAGASAWLEANTPQDSRVFQTDWDDFPRLFYYNTHNTYLIGLDPTYMSLYAEDLYNDWVKITQGDVEQPSIAIANEFGSSYVITDLRHQDFMRRAADDPGLVETYRDEFAVVYQVIETE